MRVDVADQGSWVPLDPQGPLHEAIVVLRRHNIRFRTTRPLGGHGPAELLVAVTDEALAARALAERPGAAGPGWRTWIPYVVALAATAAVMAAALLL